MSKLEYEDGIPLRTQIGWAEGVSKKDAIAIAKGYIQKRFDAVEASWYAVAPYMGGYFWEVQECGQGRSYLQGVTDALSDDPGSVHWLPCGDRAFQVMMRDGKPFCILLSSDDSRDIMNAGSGALPTSGKMSRAVSKGTAWLAFGAATFAISFSFLIAASVLYALAGTPGPAVRDIKIDALGLSQWKLVENTVPTEVVSKLEFVDGKWVVEKRAHVIPDQDQENIEPIPNDAVEDKTTDTSGVLLDPQEIGVPTATDADIINGAQEIVQPGLQTPSDTQSIQDAEQDR